MISKLKMIRFIKDYPLSIGARAVLSYLAYRARLGKGASGKRIARELRMGQTKSVKPALQLLEERGLVVRRSKGWRCPPLPDNCYMSRKNTWEEDWTKRYCFWFFRIPESKSKVTLLQAVMLGFIANREKSAQKVTTSCGYLSVSLGITLAQARYNYKRLINLGLVTTLSTGFGNFVAKTLPPTEVTNAYFKPENARVAAPKQIQVSHSYKQMWQKNLFTRWTGRKHGFTSNQAHQLIEWIVRFGSNAMLQIEGLEDLARKIHVRNIDEGKVVGDKENYYRLWWRLAVEVIGETYGIKKEKIAVLLNYK